MLPVLIPIVAELAKNGLELLGNALLVKGKDYIEEKTGVTLSETMSSDDLRKLKEFQLMNELEFAKLRQQDDRLTLEFYQAEIKDRETARVRDATFVSAGTRNHRADIMALLCFVVVAWLVWQVWAATDITEFTKGIITLVLGRFLGYMDTIFNFEFGSTRTNKSMVSTIETLSKGPKP